MRGSVVFVLGLLLGSIMAPGVAQETRRAGIDGVSHIAISVEEPRVGFTKALITFATDPAGVRIELGEFGPESMQRKAIDSWKDIPRR